jgi:hypothetical protein
VAVGFPGKKFRVAKIARNRGETISIALQKKLETSRNTVFCKMVSYANGTERNENSRKGAVERMWRNEHPTLKIKPWFL